MGEMIPDQIDVSSSGLSQSPENRGLVWLSHEELANGFRKYNEGLGVQPNQQADIDDLLEAMSNEVDPELADHDRRVGGYAGALLRTIGGEQYGTTFHEGIIRVMCAVHDIGKIKIDKQVMMRSLMKGDRPFDRELDMPEMRKHPEAGFEMVKYDSILPPETKFIAGCHHQFPPVEGDEPYGIPLSKIAEEFPGDENATLRDWIHFAIKITALADYYDSYTNRIGKSTYYTSATIDDVDIYNHVSAYAQKLFPDNWQTAIKALQDEQIYYNLKAPQAA
jgi:hypothetical protein